MNNLTPITYFQLGMQQQWRQNQQAIMGKAYQDFFADDILVAKEKLDLLKNSPIPSEQVPRPTVEGLNNLFGNLDNLPQAGWGIVDDENHALFVVTSRHFYPKVNSQMMKWWFEWHPLENERYTLWFPHAHISNTVKYPERLTDPNLTYEQKLYGNPNYVVEYIGGQALPIVIHFTDPLNLGLSQETLDKNHISFSASGWVTPQETDIPMAIMVHLGREVDGGFELLSCYYMGASQEWERYQQGAGEQALQHRMPSEKLQEMGYEMALHDLTEYSRLGQILPELYSKFGQ